MDNIKNDNVGMSAGEAIAFFQPEPTEYVISDEARARIENTFTYHSPKGDQQRRYEGLRETAKMLAYRIEAYAPDSREKSLAKTHLEEAVMWANKAIANNE